jgi:RNA polymerase sigma-70 factor (ECF subfamily)
MERLLSFESYESYDHRLFHAMQQGEEQAFEVLFGKYHKLLNKYACRYIPSEDAEEVVQDTFLWVWEKRQTLIIESSFHAYLLKAVYHRTLNRIKSNEARHRAHLHFHELSQAFARKHDEQPMADELIAPIREAIHSLPDNYRACFIMHRFKAMTYKEIAQVLHVSTQTVNYRIYKALQLLRATLIDAYKAL